MQKDDLRAGKWPILFLQALAALGASVLLIELGEFAVLVYVWGFVTREKIASPSDNWIVLGTSLVTIFSTLLLCLASLFSIHFRRIWPNFRVCIGLAMFVAGTQFFFLLLNEVSFESEWLNEFFRSKTPTFAGGLASAIVLLIVTFLADRITRAAQRTI